MPENGARESSIADQETDRSLGHEIDAGGPVLVSVPTMIRRDDNIGTNTDGGDSIYNPHYSIQSLTDVKPNGYLNFSYFLFFISILVRIIFKQIIIPDHFLQDHQLVHLNQV
jgi:hypothetical protein